MARPHGGLELLLGDPVAEPPERVGDHSTDRCPPRQEHARRDVASSPGRRAYGGNGEADGGGFSTLNVAYAPLPLDAWASTV